MSRDVALLTPPLRALCKLHLDACRAVGLDPIVTYTLRTALEQEALYAQGREPLLAVNDMRVHVGLPPITEKENLRIVSWTKHSKHLAGPDGFAEAYDIALRQAGGVVWDPHQDGNHNFEPDWSEAARIAESICLSTGDRLYSGLRFGDAPHFQLQRARP